MFTIWNLNCVVVVDVYVCATKRLNIHVYMNMCYLLFAMCHIMIKVKLTKIYCGRW